MTDSCFKSISPDGLTGMIFAMEGMRESIVLLNGPMGCRFYHSSTSGFLMRRPLLYLPAEKDGRRVPVDYNYLNDWFFRQERVPCTYLDGHDYVYGTGEKAAEALMFIEHNIDFSLLTVVNSPGAALIGDDILNIAQKAVPDKTVVYLESPGYSVSFDEGYSEACLAMLKKMLAQRPSDRRQSSDLQKSPDRQQASGLRQRPRPCVNLLGMSIWHRYCEGDSGELKRLLRLCGIEVNAIPCADCSIDALKNIPDADLNIVLYPDAGLASALYLKEQFRTPCYICDSLPIGFSQTEKMIAEICARLGVSDKAFRRESERSRAIAWSKLNGIYQMYGKPKGVPFHVAAAPYIAASFSSFLSEYLGMEETGPEDAELLFSDANRISERSVQGRPFCGIEIAFPGMGYTDLTVKTHMGLTGALFLIEQVLNGIMSK